MLVVPEKHILLATHTSENVIEDKIATTLWHQIESLDVAHGLWLIINLRCVALRQTLDLCNLDIHVPAVLLSP